MILIINSRSTEAVLTGDGFLVFCQLQYMGTPVAGVHLLYVVVGRTYGSEVIHPDQVGAPLPSVNMCEQWSIGSHVDDVGITLEASHQGCLTDSCVEHVLCFGEIGSMFFDMTGILTGEHLRTLTAIVVITGDIIHEPVLVAVVVLIHQVYLQTAHLLPTVVELITIRRWTGRTNDLDFRMTVAQYGDELLQSLWIERSPLLITDT